MVPFRVLCNIRIQSLQATVGGVKNLGMRLLRCMQVGKDTAMKGIFPVRQFPLCQFPLRQFPFGQLPTLSIPILSIPIWSMLTKRELTKWELTKWEVD